MNREQILKVFVDAGLTGKPPAWEVSAGDIRVWPIWNVTSRALAKVQEALGARDIWVFTAGGEVENYQGAESWRGATAAMRLTISDTPHWFSMVRREESPRVAALHASTTAAEFFGALNRAYAGADIEGAYQELRGEE